MIPYSAPGEQARSTPVLAAFVLLWAFWLIANTAMVPVIALVAPPLLKGQAAAPKSMGLLLLLTFYVMFSVFAACALLWVRFYERRNFSSAGLVWYKFPGRYLRGLFWGAAFAVALLLVAGLVAIMAPEKMGAQGHFSWGALSRPKTLMIFAALIFGLLLQSAAEEIICRGWVLSSIALRHGRVAGLIASSLFFGSLHVHFLFFGNPIAGLVAIMAITFMGVMLGLYALGEGSLAGAAGMHGAFNALVFTVTLAIILGTGEATEALEGLNVAYELSTQPKELSAEGFVQGGLALLVSIILGWRIWHPRKPHQQ